MFNRVICTDRYQHLSFTPLNLLDVHVQPLKKMVKLKLYFFMLLLLSLFFKIIFICLFYEENNSETIMLGIRFWLPSLSEMFAKIESSHPSFGF